MQPQPQQNQPLLIKAATLSQDDLEIIKTTFQQQGNKPHIGTKLKKSASMKLKRSWFPAFRLGGNSHQVQVSQPQSNSSVQNSTVSGQNSSKTSIVRRSSSRLNVNSSVALNPSADDYGAAGTGTPILLSVRKRSTSDSGYSGTDKFFSFIKYRSGFTNNWLGIVRWIIRYYFLDRVFQTSASFSATI